jgi:transcriptional regulator with XRE-family HTH domain
MPRDIPPPLSVALTFLRAERGWTQKELADAVGISDKVLSFYERGRAHLRRPLLETMVAAMGLGTEAIDVALFAIQQIRPGEKASAGFTEAERQGIERATAFVGQALAEATRSELSRRQRLFRMQQAHDQAAALWEYLKKQAPYDRRVLVEVGKDYRSWALAVRLCDESEKAAADDAGRAVELASLAVRAAERAPGEEGWRRRLQGYAWAFLGNSRRVAGDLSAAHQAFDRFLQYWGPPEPTNPGLLPEWRVLDLEASLRREQRQWNHAFRLHDQAQTTAPPEELGRILVKRAMTLEQSGDHERAIATLTKAAPHVDIQRNPRLGFALYSNLALNLCRLERFTAAEKVLPNARRLAAQLGNALDLLRLRWPEALTAAGLGRRAEAIEAFSYARAGFLDRDMAYDAALATLELAVLYLEDGRSPEVKMLARQMEPIFRAQGVHREALAALKLFRDAVEKEEATVDLARRLAEYLHRARYDPDLRFEGRPE